MRIFAIADLHLSLNENVDKPMDIFGSGWENHTARLEHNWKKEIREEDIVVLPGDLSWGLKFEEALPDLEWIHNLPGTKVAFKGNHDLWWSGIKKLNALFDDMHFVQNEAFMASEDLAICGARGWVIPGTDDFTEHDQKIYDRELRRLENSLKDAVSSGAREILVAMHYPPAYIKKPTTEFTKVLHKYGITHCVYGHLHGMLNFGRALRGVHDGIYYRLVSLDYLYAQPRLIYDDGFVD